LFLILIDCRQVSEQAIANYRGNGQSDDRRQAEMYRIGGVRLYHKTCKNRSVIITDACLVISIIIYGIKLR
jgi:hypothetical protein